LTLFLVIRLRGNLGVAPEVLDTMNRLNLPKKQNASLVADTPSNLGMLQKVADYITWGEVTADTLEAMLAKRGRLDGDKKITPEKMNELEIGSFKALSEKVLGGGQMPAQVKRTFRLTPPSGGFKRSIKRHFGSGGELGYRGAEINQLVLRMI